ncbi:MAG: tRNA adenosine(34) deaminase TadA [Verrucomicrobiota bacterium]
MFEDSLSLPSPADDEQFMGEALRQAKKAYQQSEVPVGAVVVRSGKIIARGYNQVELLKDATAHAEMLALTSAQGSVGDWRLTECDLYVTKEPCPMCAGALYHCRIRRVIFGCQSPKDGACGSLLNLLDEPSLNHQAQVVGEVRADECRFLLRQFFQEARGTAGTENSDPT